MLIIVVFLHVELTSTALISWHVISTEAFAVLLVLLLAITLELIFVELVHVPP